MAAKKTDPRACTKVIHDLIKANEKKRAYLLYGEESYLVQQNKHNLIKYLTADMMDDMNINRYQGPDIDANQVVEMAETLPFFADYRVILVENSGWFAEGNSIFEEYIKRIPDTTIFVFVEQKVDGRKTIVSGMKEVGVVVNYLYQEDDVLAAWMKKRAADAGLMMSPAIAKLLIGRVGNQMQRLSMELEKVISYCLGNAEITAKDVDAVCTDTIEDRVFEMVEAVSLKNQKRVMVLYKDLLLLKQAPAKVLAIINSEYARMMSIKYMMEKGMNDTAIATALGMHSFAVGKRMPTVRKYKMDELKKCLNQGIQADHSYKAGKITDRMALEILLVELTQ